VHFDRRLRRRHGKIREPPGFSQYLLTAETRMEKFAGGVACEADRASVQRGKKASGGKACQLRKTLTAEPGTAWRPLGG
jgi:hypothetical protein